MRISSGKNFLMLVKDSSLEKLHRYKKKNKNVLDTQKSPTTLISSAPLGPITIVERRLHEKDNDIHSFNNSIYNPREIITYFKDENRKSKMTCKNAKC